MKFCFEEGGIFELKIESWIFSVAVAVFSMVSVLWVWCFSSRTRRMPVFFHLWLLWFLWFLWFLWLLWLKWFIWFIWLKWFLWFLWFLWLLWFLWFIWLIWLIWLIWFLWFLWFMVFFVENSLSLASGMQNHDAGMREGALSTRSKMWVYGTYQVTVVPWNCFSWMNEQLYSIELFVSFWSYDSSSF